MNARRCFLQTVVALVVFTIARSFGLLGGPVVSAIVLAAVLVLIAWRAKATLADLALDRAHFGSGLRWGLASLALVVLVLAAALLPVTNRFLHDSRGAVSGGRLVYELIVEVLLVTAIPEELAFRGVLLGSALRLGGRWRATLVTSVLFGLWHIAPTLHTAPGPALSQALDVLGAVTATFFAGLAFAWLRLRSNSLIAPIIAHVATNGVALTAAWIVAH